MATIKENKKNGKTVSYRFTVCLERDIRGKQIREYTTWKPDEGLTPAKARKAAERAADAWEQEVRAEYQKKKALGQAYTIPAEKRRDDFTAFVNDTWFPLQVCGGNDKPTTIAFYQHMAKYITDYFQGAVLQEIGPIDIQKYLVYLRTQYKSRLGKPLAPKTLRHQYATLNLIFGYAEKQEMIVKNPINKVDAPKREKKPVDGEPRKVCVKENKRHPFSQELEQEMNLIERKYYNGTDTEGNAESIREQPEVQQHHRDHGRDERDVPGRIAAGDGKRAGYGAGVRKKSAHVGNGCRKQASKLSQRALEKDGKNAIGGGGSEGPAGPKWGI